MTALLDLALSAAYCWVAFAGLSFIYFGLLYEDEERQAQDVIERWWCRLDDAERKLVPKHLAILRHLSAKLLLLLDRVFGPANLSWRAALAAYCVLEIGGLASFVYMYSSWPRSYFARFPPITASTLVLLSLQLLIAAFGLTAAYVGPRRLLPLVLAVGWLSAPHILRFSRSIGLAGDPSRDPGNLWVVLPWPSLSPVLIQGIGVATLLATIAAHRAVLRRATVLPAVPLVTLAIATCLLPLTPWIVPYRTYFFLRLTVDAVTAGLWVFVFVSPWALFLSSFLLHRIWWPLLSRPVYAAARHRLISNKWLMVTIGLGLLSLLVPGLLPWLYSVVQRLLPRP